MTSKSTNGTPLSHISDEYLETICPQFTELFNSMTCYQQVHCLFCRLQKPQLKNLTTPIIGMTKLLGKNCADFYFNVNKDVVSTKQTRFNLTSLLLMTSQFIFPSFNVNHNSIVITCFYYHKYQKYKNPFNYFILHIYHHSMKIDKEEASC